MRRTMRLVRMATAAALRPGGTVLEVFRSSAERQAAYDFLANPDIRQEEPLAAMAVATANRCEDDPFVFVVVDGTSLTLADRARAPSGSQVFRRAHGSRSIARGTATLRSSRCKNTNKLQPSKDDQA